MSLSAVLVLACLIMSISLSIAHVQPHSFWFPVPPLPGQDLTQCLLSFQNSEGCLRELYITGRVGTLGPACCKGITEINDNCWAKMFPFNPFLPTLLKDYCSNKIGAPPASPTIERVRGVVQSGLSNSADNEGKSPDTFGLDPECLSSLCSVEGCLQEVVISLISFQVHLIGPACCEAVITITEGCWPKLCPFNPFFPPLVKDCCTKLLDTSPTSSKNSPN